MMMGVYVVIEGWRLGFGAWREPGTGFLAVLSGTVIFFLSALWIVITLVKKWGIETTKKFFSKPDSYKRVILTIVTFAVYTFLLDKAGFMVSTFIFLIFLFRAIEPQSWRLVIVVALFVTILSVLVFQVWLAVPLPEGFFSIYSIEKWIRHVI